MLTGLVIAAHGRRGLLETAAGERHAWLVTDRRLRVVCGDRVNWTRRATTSEAVVLSIDARSNSLARVAPGTGTVEVLAANLSLIAVVVAPEPAPDWFLADRFLCAAGLMAADALLVLNKADLGDIDPAELDAYARAGYALLPVSARQRTGLEALARAFDGQTGVLVGQSGVGKSSLLNALVPDADAATGALSRATAEGIHTTSASIMHRLPAGGRLIDTPGVRDFVPAIPAEVSVQIGFPEIVGAAPGCRFSDCLHLREPGCAVKAAVDAGGISARRYESYRRLVRSVPAPTGAR